MHCGDRPCEYQLDPRISMGLAQGVHKGPSFAIKSLTYSQSKILESWFNLHDAAHVVWFAFDKGFLKRHFDKKRMNETCVFV